MRVVTLDAPPPRLCALGLVPIPVGPAMRAVLPVAVDGSMTLAAQQLRLIPRDLTPVVIHEGVSIRAMMAVEATRVDAVIQLNLRMLSQRAGSLGRRRQ